MWLQHSLQKKKRGKKKKIMWSGGDVLYAGSITHSGAEGSTLNRAFSFPPLASCVSVLLVLLVDVCAAVRLDVCAQIATKWVNLRRGSFIDHRETPLAR